MWLDPDGSFDGLFGKSSSALKKAKYSQKYADSDQCIFAFSIAKRGKRAHTQGHL
jgi:hypothetical protein